MKECYVMLRREAKHYAMLSYIMLSYIVSCHFALHYITSRYIAVLPQYPG